MPDPKIVVSNHLQHFQMSCAASGMELILKLHSLVAPNFREFQDKYGDTNIGFEKLADLAAYNVQAHDEESLIDDGFAAIQEEINRGRYPLASIYCDPIGWHIWVAIPDRDAFKFVSKGYNIDNMLDISLSDARANLERYRKGRIHYATYDVVES
jgi:hypothetical protein